MTQQGRIFQNPHVKKIIPAPDFLQGSTAQKALCASSVFFGGRKFTHTLQSGRFWKIVPRTGYQTQKQKWKKRTQSSKRAFQVLFPSSHTPAFPSPLQTHPSIPALRPHPPVLFCDSPFLKPRACSDRLCLWPPHGCPRYPRDKMILVKQCMTAYGKICLFSLAILQIDKIALTSQA